ncbi:MAG: hypothetical protein ACP5N7_03150 [Candidatus Pacearchaeota archaeon]
MKKEIWFKRKLYGWGWTPCTWQGWIITLMFILFLVYIATEFLVVGRFVEYFVLLGISIALLMYICYKKGEKPRWAWGK